MTLALRVFIEPRESSYAQGVMGTLGMLAPVSNRRSRGIVQDDMLGWECCRSARRNRYEHPRCHHCLW